MDEIFLLLFIFVFVALALLMDIENKAKCLLEKKSNIYWAEKPLPLNPILYKHSDKQTHKVTSFLVGGRGIQVISEMYRLRPGALSCLWYWKRTPRLQCTELCSFKASSSHYFSSGTSDHDSPEPSYFASVYKHFIKGHTDLLSKVLHGNVRASPSFVKPFQWTESQNLG